MQNLTPEEKALRARERMLETARGCNYKPKVAAVFQRMIRAEFGADDRLYVTAVVDGSLRQVRRDIGQVVCVTCGKVGPWSSGLGGMHTGHFVASRSNSILFEETNVAPQCSRCNRYNHGEPALFRVWMEFTHGAAEVERLQRLKNQSRKFTNEDLVDMMIGYQSRLKAAVAFIEGATA